MRYWCGYTNGNIIICHGRAIRHASDRGLQPLAEQAAQHSIADVAKETFTAAYIAAAFAQEHLAGIPPETTFTHAGQLLTLFEDADIEQAALNLLNGKIASAYASTEQIREGFHSGELLQLPRDAAQLYIPEKLAMLPGVVVFLLLRAHAERKAFLSYLRKGEPPLLNHETLANITYARRAQRTCERELRLATHYKQERSL